MTSNLDTLTRFTTTRAHLRRRCGVVGCHTLFILQRRPGGYAGPHIAGQQLALAMAIDTGFADVEKTLGLGEE